MGLLMDLVIYRMVVCKLKFIFVTILKGMKMEVIKTGNDVLWFLELEIWQLIII